MIEVSCFDVLMKCVVSAQVLQKIKCVYLPLLQVLEVDQIHSGVQVVYVCLGMYVRQLST